MAELQLSPSLSPELLLQVSVKQTVGVSATTAVSFQKVLHQFGFFFSRAIAGVFIFSNLL